MKVFLRPNPSFFQYLPVFLLSVLLISGSLSAFAQAERPAAPVQTSGEHILIHHWNFNDIPNDVYFSKSWPELLNISSRLYGALLSYDGGDWDRVNDPTPLNARETPYVEEDDRALRLRNPSGTFTVALPTRGFRNVVLRYAVTRTFNGAHQHDIAYSTDGGATYRTDGLPDTVVTVNEADYQLVEFDFSGVEEVDDNPDFQVRLTLSGTGSEPENESGNQRFNHVTLEGDVIEEETSRDLIHHWDFNNIPNDVNFPTGWNISSGGITGGESTVDDAWIRYDGDSWDRVNDPTPFNARANSYDEEDDRAMRMRNPTGDFTLRLPTTGYDEVIFRYAVKRSPSGAMGQRINWSADGSVFVTDGLDYSTVQVGEKYVLHVLDFSDMEEVNDNPEFTIRILATGEGSETDNPDGNQRFNHITLDARPMSTSVDPEEALVVPDRIRLEQNYPNPFNPATQLQFALPHAAHVLLEVFDINGRHVGTLIDGTMPAGQHTHTFNAEGLSSGIYLGRLQVDDQILMRRMTIVK
ncbi:MAG: T9SS type A sorting domain-containing protein [Balneolales bacterium]